MLAYSVSSDTHVFALNACTPARGICRVVRTIVDRTDAMKIADVMSDAVEFVATDASVKEAAELMGELDVGGLPVGTADKLEGMLTDRDILFRVVAAGRDPTTVRVGEVTSRPAITCREADSLQTAMDTMMANHVRRLPICDERGRITGVVTLADLARKLLVGSEPLQAALNSLTESAAPDHR